MRQRSSADPTCSRLTSTYPVTAHHITAHHITTHHITAHWTASGAHLLMAEARGVY